MLNPLSTGAEGKAEKETHEYFVAVNPLQKVELLVGSMENP